MMINDSFRLWFEMDSHSRYYLFFPSQLGVSLILVIAQAYLLPFGHLYTLRIRRPRPASLSLYVFDILYDILCISLYTSGDFSNIQLEPHTLWVVFKDICWIRFLLLRRWINMSTGIAKHVPHNMHTTRSNHKSTLNISSRGDERV